MWPGLVRNRFSYSRTTNQGPFLTWGLAKSDATKWHLRATEYRRGASNPSINVITLPSANSISSSFPHFRPFLLEFQFILSLSSPWPNLDSWEYQQLDTNEDSRYPPVDPLGTHATKSNSLFRSFSLIFSTSSLIFLRYRLDSSEHHLPLHCICILMDKIDF